MHHVQNKDVLNSCCPGPRIKQKIKTPTVSWYLTFCIMEHILWFIYSSHTNCKSIKHLIRNQFLFAKCVSITSEIIQFNVSVFFTFTNAQTSSAEIKWCVKMTQCDLRVWCSVRGKTNSRNHSETTKSPTAKNKMWLCKSAKKINV